LKRLSPNGSKQPRKKAVRYQNPVAVFCSPKGLRKPSGAHLDASHRDCFKQRIRCGNNPEFAASPWSPGAVAQTLIGVFFTPMSQSKDCKDTINKEAGVKNTPTSVCFVDFSLWATAPPDHGSFVLREDRGRATPVKLTIDFLNNANDQYRFFATLRSVQNDK
jgi:hypothetical protein